MSHISTSIHPRVWLWQKTGNGVYIAGWRDPRKKNKTTNSSLETADLLQAQERARDLSIIIRTPEFWDRPPVTLDAVARRIWGADDLLGDLTKATDELEKRDAGKVYLPSVKEQKAIVALGDAGALEFLKKYDMKDPLVIRFKDLHKRFVDALVKMDSYQQRIMVLESWFKKIGKKVSVDLRPKPLNQAVDEYLASPTGSNTTGRYRKTIGYWLADLKTKFGETTNVLDLQSEMVTDWLAGFLKENSSGNVRQRMDQICKFLRWANPMFESAQVKNVLKPMLQKKHSDLEVEDWYWLTREQVKLLIESMRKLHGEYWANLMTLQHALGVRPEEIVMLKRQAVTKTANGPYSIKIERIMIIEDGKNKVLRRVKTLRSSDEIVIPSFAVSALEAQMKKKTFLLFPLTDDAAAVSIDALTRKERFLKLWPTADDAAFSRAYLRRIKAAVDHANENAKANIDGNKTDSRTMRRTCAREMILAHGFEHAAAVLRDSVETLRRHYADLQASDVNTER